MSKKAITKREQLAKITGGLQEERATLDKNRNQLYEQFFRNIRLLRASQGLSAVEFAAASGIASGTRILHLEYGRGTPTTEEIMLYAKHFSHTLDDLLYKTATVSFI